MTLPIPNNIKRGAFAMTSYMPLIQLTPSMIVGMAKWSDGTYGTHGILYPDQGVLNTTEQSAILTALNAMDDNYTVDDEIYSVSENKKFVVEDYFKGYRKLLNFTVKVNQVTSSTLSSVGTYGSSAFPYSLPLSFKMALWEKISTTAHLEIYDPVNNLRFKDTSLGNVDIRGIVELTTDKIAVIYVEGGTLKAKAGTINMTAGTITFGAAATISASADVTDTSACHSNACNLTTDAFAVIFFSTNTKVMALTVSGTTITPGTAITLTSSTSGVGSITKITTSKVGILWRDTVNKFRAATVAGTTFTMGADISITKTGSSGMCANAVNSALVAITEGSSTVIEAVTVSGTVSTAGGTATLLNGENSSTLEDLVGNTLAATSSNTKFVYRTTTSVHLLSTSGGTLTDQTYASIDNGGSAFPIFACGDDKFGQVTRSATPYVITPFTVDVVGNTITVQGASPDRIDASAFTDANRPGLIGTSFVVGLKYSSTDRLFWGANAALTLDYQVGSNNGNDSAVVAKKTCHGDVVNYAGSANGNKLYLSITNTGPVQIRFRVRKLLAEVV